MLPPCRRAQNEALCDLLFDITYQRSERGRRLGLSSSGRSAKIFDFCLTNVFLVGQKCIFELILTFDQLRPELNSPPDVDPEYYFDM